MLNIYTTIIISLLLIGMHEKFSSMRTVLMYFYLDVITIANVTCFEFILLIHRLILLYFFQKAA